MMHVERWLRLIAGSFVLVSVALGWAVSPWFLLFTAFVGANLVQSALTNWCPMMAVLRAAGVKEACEVELTPARLASPRSRP